MLDNLMMKFTLEALGLAVLVQLPQRLETEASHTGSQSCLNDKVPVKGQDTKALEEYPVVYIL